MKKFLNESWNMPVALQWHIKLGRALLCWLGMNYYVKQLLKNYC